MADREWNVNEVLLGVATPSGGWCAPADAVCVCGSTVWPHDCVWAGLKTRLLDLPDEVNASRGVVVLPPCPMCGRTDWPAGGMHAVRDIHIRAHERKGEAADV